MKKMIISALLLCLVASPLMGCTGKKEPADTTEASATAAETLAETPAENFKYVLSPDGESIGITEYTGTADTVVIPSMIDGKPVKFITTSTNDDGSTHGAFEGSRVKKVVLPDGFISLGYRAFKDCTELTDINFPSTLNRPISGSCFLNCTKLEKIDLSQTAIPSLENDVFRGCASLREIKFPPELTEIGDRCFYYCSALEELQLPEKLQKIGEEAPAGCSALKTVTIPPQMNLNSFHLGTFYDNPALEKIIFSEGREELVGYAMFHTVSPVEIIIPKSVKKFSTQTFAVCGKETFVFNGDCPEIVDAEFTSKVTIRYNPSTKGWDNCVWKGQYTLEPIQ